MSYITFDQVCKDYGQGEQVVHAADHVSFGIEQGELCVVLGPSGAGKTTILNLLGGMDTATSGEIRVGDKIVTAMRGKELTEYRRLYPSPGRCAKIPRCCCATNPPAPWIPKRASRCWNC